MPSAIGCIPKTPPNPQQTTMNAEQTHSGKQQAIASIAAAMAVVDMPQLNVALNQGLNAGLTVSDVNEVLVQRYRFHRRHGDRVDG